MGPHKMRATARQVPPPGLSPQNPVSCLVPDFLMPCGNSAFKGAVHEQAVLAGGAEWASHTECQTRKEQGLAVSFV
jgi:hypothetical protein